MFILVTLKNKTATLNLQVKEVLVVQAKKDTSELVKKKEEVTQVRKGGKKGTHPGFWRISGLWSLRSLASRKKHQNAKAKKSTDEAIKKLEDAKKQLSEALTAMPSVQMVHNVSWSLMILHLWQRETISNDFWKNNQITLLLPRDIQAFLASCQASGKVSEAEALRDRASHTFSLACDTSSFLEQLE